MTGLDLTGLDEYAPAVGGVKLVSALVDTDLEVVFGQVEGKAAELKVSGDVSVRKFAADNKAGLPWHLEGERLTVRVKDLDLMLQSPIAADIEAADLYFQQSDKPKLHINALSVSDARADLATRKASFTLAATLNDKGSLKAGGNVGWAPLSAELDIDMVDADIVATQGMLIERPGMLITKGLASFKGTVAAAGSPLSATVKGDARITDFNMLDRVTQEDLLRWKELEVSGITAKTLPLDVAIKSVVQSDFYARIIIMPDGSLRLRDVMAPSGGTLPMLHAAEQAVERQAEQKTEKKVEKTPSGTVTTATVAEEKPALPVRERRSLI